MALLAKKESITSSIVYYGFWQNVDQVDSSLREFHSDKEKREILTAQLHFRKTVLRLTHPDPSVFNLGQIGETGKYRKYPVARLRENLLLLVHP